MSGQSPLPAADAHPTAALNGAARPARTAKKRMLLIVNPYATTVSDRLKNLVAYALQGRYEVEAVATEAQNHATELARAAAARGYDLVCAFGGDGTLNEVANGLVGSDVPLTVLPGGSANVVCRTLGIPNDVVDATEHLLTLADRFKPRRIDVGFAGDRLFLFSCGAGLDASVTQRVDAHPHLKARLGPWYYTWAAVSLFNRRYLFGRPARLRVRTPDGDAEGITAIAQNSDPFTFFGSRPVRLCEGAALDNGALSLAMLRRAALRDVPTLALRCLSERLSVADHRQVDHFQGLTTARIESASAGRDGEVVRFPVQVDGDYIGEHEALELRIEPGALTIVA